MSSVSGKIPKIKKNPWITRVPPANEICLVRDTGCRAIHGNHNILVHPDASPQDRKRIKELIARTAADLNIVDKGRAVRNMKYGADVLCAAQKDLVAAADSLGWQTDPLRLPFAPVRARSEKMRFCTRSCHLGVVPARVRRMSRQGHGENNDQSLAGTHVEVVQP